MSTYEDRIEALEQRVADIELERLYEQRKMAASTPSEQAYDIKQVNHRLTMLLGIASGQEHAIRTMQADMDLHFDAIDKQIAELRQSMETKFEQVLQQLALLSKKPE